MDSHIEAIADGIEGSYLLILECPRPLELTVGALGTRHFEPGTYAYAGSAFGPGGLKRVARHRELASPDTTQDVRHWHIDYLLGHDTTTLKETLLFPNQDLECALPDVVPGTPVPAFGATDCGCESHLLATEYSALIAHVTAQYPTHCRSKSEK